MRAYSEIPPPPALAGSVECCWVSEPTVSRQVTHRVVPDGCADIVFRVRNGSPEMLAVGAMTRFADIAEQGVERTVGIRFRPGMWSCMLGVQAHELTDKMVLLQELWGSRARTLSEQMANAASPAENAAMLTRAIGPGAQRTPVQRAIGYLENGHGMVSLDQMAHEAGLGTRQFRRVCVRETGLSPKLLARVLRFRYAQSRSATESGAHAGLAIECGFADQAHMIAEFRRFSGRTPGSLQYSPEHTRTAA